MKGKLVTLITAVCMALLIGLSVSVSAQETVTVLMGVDLAGKEMTERAEEFEKLTGIKIDVVIVSWDDLTTKQAVALASQSPTYDVLDTCRPWIAQYAPTGYYEPLTNYISKKRLGELVPALVDHFSYEGTLYAHPLMASWTIMFYNKKMFKEAGLNPEKPPRTWDEFVAMGKKLTKDTDGDGMIDQYGYIDSYMLGQSGLNTFFRFLYTAGGKFFERRKDKVYFTFNSSRGVEALEFMRDLVERYKIMHPGVFTYDQQDCASLFAEGKAAMFNNWEMMSLVLNDPARSKIVGNVGYALSPGRTVELSGASQTGHEALAISSFSQHKKAAWKWIEFITSKENIKKRGVEQGFTPVYSDLFSDPELLENMPQFKVVLEASKHQFRPPAIAEYQQIATIVSEQVQLALMEGKAREALDLAAEKANKLVGW